MGYVGAMSSEPPALSDWHRVLAQRDPALLADLLTEDAVFHSPVLHRPQAGRDLVMMYLTGAMHVLANDSFQYVREVVGDHDAVLEFTATVDDIHVNGVDMIAWNDDGQITDFKVMLRPKKALDLVQRRMAELLAATQAE